MFSSKVGLVSKSQTPQVFSRSISGGRGKNIEYPFYRFERIKNAPSKSHKTNLRFAMEAFLGPKNYKGEYYLNRYYYAPKNHQPKYITPNQEQGNPLTDNPRNSQPRSTIRPFPQNPNCKTNSLISKEMKTSMLRKIEEGESLQQVAFQFDISINRLEAVLKLNEIENQWNKNEKNQDLNLKRFNDTLYEMFPLYENSKPENLTEIPVPTKTLKSKFLAIAESEPFGPVDAAKILGLEPAGVTLEKLSKGHESENEYLNKNNKKVIGFKAPVFEHEKSVFKFTNAKVGEVGIRYGRSNRDNKKDRKVGFNEIGQRVYI